MEYGLDKFRQKRPSELSGGMKQRAALIRTLALEPQLLLLDEPFSALDYQTRLSVSADICRLIREAKKTMIIVTHDLAEAISLADRILILSGRPATNQGRTSGSPNHHGQYTFSCQKLRRNFPTFLINYGRK